MMTLEQVLEKEGTTLESIHGHYFSGISNDELETITKEIGTQEGTTIYEIYSDHGTLWLACRDGSAYVLCQDDLDQELDKGEAFHAEMARLEQKGEGTSPYVWNSEVAHMRDCEQAWIVPQGAKS